jgi:hypothetical protein
MSSTSTNYNENERQCQLPGTVGATDFHHKWTQDMCKTYIQKKSEDCEELEIDEDGRRGRCGESERHSAGDQDVMRRVDLA